MRLHVMRSLQIAFVTTLVGLCGLAATARADDKFHPVPAFDKSPATGLEARIVSYDGTSNGKMMIEVVNRGTAAATFNVRGIYFVPDGEHDSAPQRLTSLAFAIVDDREGARRQTVAVRPGGDVKLQVDVFCVDLHRHSPSTDTPFTMAAHRLPQPLAGTLATESWRIARSEAGFDDASTRGDVQRMVWNQRDKKWIAIDGEGAQEKHRERPDYDEE